MDLLQRFKLWYYTQPPALRAVLTINVVLYLAWQLLFRHIGVTALFTGKYLALLASFPEIVYHPWQLITYSFLHTSAGLNGFLHILFNMLWLVWVGRDFEYSDGSNRFLAVYILAAIGGGLLAVLEGVLFSKTAFVVGASGSVLGILAAVATYYPTRSIGLLFIGNIRLAYIIVGFLFLDILFAGASSTAIGAHLGGALTGFLFAKAEKSGVDLHTWAGVFFPTRKRRKRSSPSPAGTSTIGRLENWLGSRDKKQQSTATIHTLPTRDEADPPVEKTKAEKDLDRLLDKISEQGIESLTEEERAFLDNESRK